MAGIADTVAGDTSGRTGATTTGLGCSTAGSSSFTTGACVHADSSIAAVTSSTATPDACFAGRSGRRNKVGITLMFPFKLEEVIVATGRAIWVVPADCGTTFINGAAALGLIKKHAHGLVYRIFTVAKHAHRLAFVLNLFGKFLTRYIHRNTVMFGQTRDIRRFSFNVVIATAIARAFGAVVSVLGCHDADFKLFAPDSKGLCVSNDDDLSECCVRPAPLLEAEKRFLACVNDEANRGPSRSYVAVP